MKIGVLKNVAVAFTVSTLITALAMTGVQLTDLFFFLVFAVAGTAVMTGSGIFLIVGVTIWFADQA